MIGTMYSVTLAMRCKPPNTTIPENTAITIPIIVASKLNAVCKDKEIVLDCTELKISP